MSYEEKMTIDEIRKYLHKIRPMYRRASKKEKGRLLDEMETVTKLHRKHLIRLITGQLRRKRREKQRGRVYGIDVDDANGQPGLFHDLSRLKWGDEVIVHAYGQTYVYEVRTVEKYVKPDDTSSVFRHEDYPWLTLITCRGCDEDSDSYLWRIAVRAVQTKID